MRSIAKLALCALSLGFSTSAQARDFRYQFYSVTGVAPAALLASLKRNAPSADGAKAYGKTVMTYSIRSNLAMEGGMCRAANYNVNLNFVISLPKLASAGPSSAQAASAWKQFQSFVTTHEHHHRDLWTGCRDTHVLQARKTSARSCKQLADKLGTMWSKAQDTCQGYHAAFDRAQRAPLLAQPLIRAALR